MSGGGRRKTACVTGGNGYIASALIVMLLNKGYSVKTSVRDPDDKKKNSHLEGLRGLGPLEIFRADLDIMGSFDEAVAGCDYAFLVAAPMEQNPEDPGKVVEAAVRGTSNVIRSCVRAGSVKRVILTSSIAAVALSGRLLQGEGHVLDEESWSDVDFLRAYAKSGAWAYPVSKVLLEKEACKLALEKGISLVTVCPVITIGKAPSAKAEASISFLSGDEAKIESLKRTEKAMGSIPMVHLHDLCRAQIFVAEEESVCGRYICCSLNTTALQLARFLALHYPQYDVKIDRVADLGAKPRVCVSSAKLIRQGFQYKYNTLEEIYHDVVDYARAAGILPGA